MRITLDQAIQIALQHNHNLNAAQTTIQQSQAQEITANLRPNPRSPATRNILPFFQPNEFSSTYFDSNAQFDIGLSYSVRARQETPASAAGCEGSHGRDAIDRR